MKIQPIAAAPIAAGLFFTANAQPANPASTPAENRDIEVRLPIYTGKLGEESK